VYSVLYAKGQPLHPPGHIYHLTHRCHDREFLLRFDRDRNQYRHRLRQARMESKLSLLDVDKLLCLLRTDGLEAFRKNLDAALEETKSRGGQRRGASAGSEIVLPVRRHSSQTRSGSIPAARTHSAGICSRNTTSCSSPSSLIRYRTSARRPSIAVEGFPTESSEARLRSVMCSYA